MGELTGEQEVLFAEVRVGDRVINLNQNREADGSFEVISVTPKRFICEIGWNKYAKQKMRRVYRRLDGRSVGGRTTHWVRPANFPQITDLP